MSTTGGVMGDVAGLIAAIALRPWRALDCLAIHC